VTQAIGPLVGGFLSDAAGWRWLYWVQLILSGVIFILITFTVPETYAPTILSRRAKKMRKDLGTDKYVTEMELDQQPLAQRLRVFLLRPFQLLLLEPIVMFLSLYACVIYGLLYMVRILMGNRVTLPRGISPSLKQLVGFCDMLTIVSIAYSSLSRFRSSTWRARATHPA
jgi:MFS family permease